jgi:hypothetical protein
LSNKVKTDLTFSAAALQRMGHVQWTEFHEALAAHANIVAQQMLAAPPGLLQIAQGRAQALRDLVDGLDNPAEQVKKLESKVSNGRNINAR